MRLPTVFAAFLLALVVDTRSTAQAAPWCAWYDAYTYNCGFYSFQSCLYTVRPEGGWCARSPYPEDQVYDRRPAKRKHVGRHQSGRY
jgi:uncharacterized protein DUF3551